jgi:phosphoribosylaminoimidazolecarboxamide formyltransferase/IMP cyclohydrolase
MSKPTDFSKATKASRPQPLALLSVTDKNGLIPFAQGLAALGYGLLSTGGTAAALRTAGLDVTDVSAYTGHPEIMDGRVKTLHPKVHGAILHDRDKPAHVGAATEHGIGTIDVVVVNLYRFAAEAVAKGLEAEAAIEHIDIGGPAMLRAAAKNWRHVLPVIDPEDYQHVLASLKQGGVGREERLKLAAKTFAAVSAYDAMVATYLTKQQAEPAPSAVQLPEHCDVTLTRVASLRYGENPHQAAGLYTMERRRRSGFAAIDFVQGKELSYNNILDLDAAAGLVHEFSDTAAVVVKHTNPCGVAVGKADAPLVDVFLKARACDPKSAFGGIVALNRPVDEKTATAVVELFTECIIAPAFDAAALAVFARKPALRVVRLTVESTDDGDANLTVRSVAGALLVQTADALPFAPDTWQVVTKLKPSAEELRDLAFAMRVCKHVKSNAIVFAKNGVTVGIGAGQMSRIDSCEVAIKKSAAEGHVIKGSVMGSDAFFPFRDTVDFAAKHGVKCIAQPGGSKRDDESIAAADEHKMVMVFTGRRHFRH